MTSVNKFLRQIAQGDNVRDYAHGSRAFVDNTYEYQPRYKHLFHVVFNFTPDALPYINSLVTKDQSSDLHLFVKNIDLPKFDIVVDDKNQYNRHRYTQHRINYQPINVIFHDDQSDIIRKLWYAYYSFYYQDPEYVKDTATLDRTYTVDDMYQNRENISWGLDRGPFNSTEKKFFSDIRIYSMFQKKFIEHTLVRPIISSFGHDRHDYAEGQFMEHTMQIQYETVTYASGLVNDDFPKNFAVDHYDLTPSPITPLGGGANSVFSQGGLLDAGLETIESITGGNLLGGLFGLGRTIYNAKDIDITRVITEELKKAGRDVLRGKSPSITKVFPRISEAAKKISLPGTTTPQTKVAPSNTVTSQGKVIQNPQNQPQTPSVNIGRSKVTLNKNNPPRYISDIKNDGD